MTEPDTFPESPVGPRPRRGVRRVILGVLLVSVLGIASVGIWSAWAMGGTEAGKPVQVIVPEGVSGAQIATLLEQNDVVRSGFAFRIVSRLRGVARDLKPGAYEMRTGLGISGAIDVLLEGIPLAVSRFTVPEGETIVEIADIVADKTHVSRAAFLKAARSGDHRIPIMPKGSKNLEGLLFPKTYDVVETATADDIVAMMLAQFEKEVAAIDLDRAERFGLSPYEAVVLASLVEREAKADEERPTVASVIYNRLARPMRLQIDATVQYAILLETGSYKARLLTSDYTSVRSPYNTYLIDGLPPAPIASAGLPSLRAALDPDDTEYFFYVLGPNGRNHLFARTLSEHEANKRRR